MKSVVVIPPSKVVLKDVVEPQIGSGDVLIKLTACGICGSDIGNIYGSSSKPSTRLGHEVCGIIVKKGSNVDPKYEEGQRVFVHHHASCDECHYCTHGNQTMCKSFTDSLIPCGMSEKFVLPEWNVTHGCLFVLPDSITDEEGTLIEPLACCVRAWKKIKFQKNDSCAIFGMGTIGILHALLARKFGFEKIFCIDIEDDRLDYCRKMSLGYSLNSKKEDISNAVEIHTSRIGVDVVIIATAQMSLVNDALDIVRKGGTILIFGEPKSNSIIDIDMSKLYSKEVTITTTYAASNSDVASAISLIRDKSIDVRNLVTHKFSIDRSMEALEFARKNKKAIKVVITGPYKT